MEKPYNQTSAYITPTSTYIPTHTHMSDFENYTLNTNLLTYWKNIGLITDCLIFSSMVLGLCFVVYGLYSLVKTGHFSQVFVINLFISDLIQTSVRLMDISTGLLIERQMINDYNVWYYMPNVYIIGVGVNICFMVFISAERYAMIAHPVWYRNIHTIRTSVFVSVTVWIIFPIIAAIILFNSDYTSLATSLFMLLPYPLVMFFFVGTWRALSRNTSVPRHEQRRIMGTLALVLSIYTVLFLPYLVLQMDFYHLFENFTLGIVYSDLSTVPIALIPLFDCLLYLFMRRDAKDILSALFCCCKRNEDNRETVTETQEATVTEAQETEVEAEV